MTGKRGQACRRDWEEKTALAHKVKKNKKKVAKVAAHAEPSIMVEQPAETPATGATITVATWGMTNADDGK